MANNYQILGLPNFSSVKDVQKAFRRMAMQYHPDKHGGNQVYEDKFKQVNAAYQVLGNVSSKALYDEQLLYGYVKPVINTPPSQAYKASKKESKKREQPKQGDNRKYTHEVKPEVKLEYSAFQKVYIKVSIGLVVIFVGIACVFNFLVDEKDSSLELTNTYERLLGRIDQSYQRNDFRLMEIQIDSIKYFDFHGPQFDQLTNQLVNGVEYHASQLFKERRLNESGTYYDYYSTLSQKYMMTQSSNSYLERIDLLYQQGEDGQAVDLAYYFIDYRMTSASEGFLLADILLKFEAFSIAKEALNVTLNAVMEGLSNKFGPTYWDELETGFVNKALLNGMLQVVFLNNNFSGEDDKILENRLPRLLKSEREKEFYYACKEVGFNNDRMLALGLDQKYKAEFEALKLNVFFAR